MHLAGSCPQLYFLGICIWQNELPKEKMYFQKCAIDMEIFIIHQPKGRIGPQIWNRTFSWKVMCSICMGWRDSEPIVSQASTVTIVWHFSNLVPQCHFSYFPHVTVNFLRIISSSIFTTKGVNFLKYYFILCIEYNAIVYLGKACMS